MTLVRPYCYDQTVVHTGFDPEAPFRLPPVPHLEARTVAVATVPAPRPSRSADSPKVTKTLARKKGRRR